MTCTYLSTVFEALIYPPPPRNIILPAYVRSQPSLVACLTSRSAVTDTTIGCEGRLYSVWTEQLARLQRTHQLSHVSVRCRPDMKSRVKRSNFNDR